MNREFALHYNNDRKGVVGLFFLSLLLGRKSRETLSHLTAFSFTCGRVIILGEFHQFEIFFRPLDS